MNLCPSLFKPTSTLDGILTRIRIPFGVIDLEQIEAISNLSDIIHITNRANIQIRTSEMLSNSVLKHLQELGLAAQNPDLDHLRNVMISPTAGIDVRGLLDTRPLAIAWLKYIENHPELAILSQKFSIGIDGGEAVSVGDRLNDISLKAIQNHGEMHTVGNQIYFSLSLVNIPTGVVIKPENVLEVLANLTEIYRQYTIELGKDKPPRLRDLINDWGMITYLERVGSNLLFSVNPIQIDLKIAETQYAHLGIHAQKQSESVYIGVVVPLGGLEFSQFRGLGEIAKEYGNGYLMLTPWQNVIISGISKLQVTNVKERVADLGLSIDRNHAYAGLVACTGITGCKSGVTDTQADAKAIADHIQKSIKLDRPINIHLTGCEKSCAQHHPSDITLLGVDTDTYQVFTGKGEAKFGRESGKYPKSELPNLIAELIQAYQFESETDDRNINVLVNYPMNAAIEGLSNSGVKRYK
jgi:ferredoxin-nitrite reductase